MSESAKVSPAQAIAALNDLDDYARMSNLAPKGAVNTLLKFITQHSNDGELNDKITKETIAFFNFEYGES